MSRNSRRRGLESPYVQIFIHILNKYYQKYFFHPFPLLYRMVKVNPYLLRKDHLLMKSLKRKLCPSLTSIGRQSTMTPLTSLDGHTCCNMLTKRYAFKLYVTFLISIVPIFYMKINQISFMLYPIHSRVGRENLVLRHSVPHFPPISGGIVC